MSETEYIPGLVSIIIPSYNSEKTISETIESAICQTHNQTEIIVIDDGSIDRTRDIIHSFGGEIKTHFGPNNGVSVARNKGGELANGEFFQYLDADDVLVPNAIECRVEALKSTHMEVAYSDWCHLVRDGNHQYKSGECVTTKIEDISSDNEVACMSQFWCPPAALLYSRRLVEKIAGWHLNLPVIQDARFLFDAARAGASFVHVDGVGAYYRVQGNNSLSKRDNQAFVEDVFLNLCEIQRLWEQDGKLNDERQNALADGYDYICRNFFWQNASQLNAALESLRRVKKGGVLQFPNVASFLMQCIGYKSTRKLLQLWSLIRSHLQSNRF